MDDYTFQFDPDDFGLFTPNRRDFLKQAAGSLTILFLWGAGRGSAQRRRQYPEDVNAYLTILADGRILCYTGKVEMGQGIVTSLAQMLADELDVHPDRIDMVMGDTDRCPYDGGTTGSRSTKVFGPALRQAGAEARAVLLSMAAENLAADVSRLDVNDGVVSTTGDSTRTVSYAELVQGREIERTVSGDVDAEPLSEHTVTGNALKRMDAKSKVSGEAKFAGDILLPNMLYARVLRPPAHGATLQSVSTASAKLPGVQIVQQNHVVAVLAEQPDLADRAFYKLQSEFETPEDSRSNATIFDHLQEKAKSTRSVAATGNVDTAKQHSHRRTSSFYYNHYVAHAPMEPHTAIADVQGDKATLWVSTQTPFRVQPEVAETLRIPQENVRIITPFLGGGFGGKKSGPFIHDAARLSQLTQRPVQVMLSRKEEFFFDHFRPAAVVQAESGIDQTGRITFWDFAHVFPGTRSSEPIYDIPHIRVVAKSTGRGEPGAHPFGTGAWRGPGSNTNVFAMESQVDIMAQAAGLDPFTFRLRNLSDRRMIRVLKAAADTFNLSFSKGPSGNGYGIACTNYLNTYVATMAEVSVDKQTGVVQVHRLVCAQDMGEIINPQGATLQIEGGLTMGLGYCLSEEVEFKGGRVLTENFDTYELPRFSWAPTIEAVLVENPDVPPQGCGEPAITTTGAVIANAVYDAIGVRFYTLPMTPERIKQALQG